MQVLMMPFSPLWCLSSRSCFPYVWHIEWSIYAGMRYIISNEQLVFEHTCFIVEVDYQNYTVVDFNESQTFMQQLFRLKTVCIYSGDRTTPGIIIRMKENLVTTIRERVETSKRRMTSMRRTGKDTVDGKLSA